MNNGSVAVIAISAADKNTAQRFVAKTKDVLIN